MDFFAVSDDILRLSLLTLVYRAAPQQTGALTTFSPSCVEAARATLHRHHDCLAVIERSSEDFFPTYVHWYVPGSADLDSGILTEQDPSLRSLHSLYRHLLPGNRDSRQGRPRPPSYFCHFNPTCCRCLGRRNQVASTLPGPLQRRSPLCRTLGPARRPVTGY
jgi:hypothetical protein